MSKVAIVGSREGFAPGRASEYVDTLRKTVTVISGGARGIDQEAAMRARQRGMEVEIYPADWATHGRKAGFIRNRTIIEAADRVVAFWNGTSKGTRHTIDLCRQLGKPLMIIYPNRQTHWPPPLRGAAASPASSASSSPAPQSEHRQGTGWGP